MEGDPSGQTRQVGESILRLAEHLLAVLRQAAAGEGLSATEARVLRYVRDEVPQGELARLLACDASRVSVLTGQLEQRGLLARRPSRSDRRRRIARLTPAGLAAVDRIGARLASTSPLVQALPPEREAVLLELLGTLESKVRS